MLNHSAIGLMCSHCKFRSEPMNNIVYQLNDIEKFCYDIRYRAVSHSAIKNRWPQVLYFINYVYGFLLYKPGFLF